MMNHLNFITPPEYDLIECCRLGGCDIFTYIDARNLLLTDKSGKNSTDRFISYLICLKIIPPTRNKWAVGLIKVLDVYYDHANKYFDSRDSDPLEILPVKQEEPLRNDLPRTYNWFKDAVKELKLDLNKLNDAQQRVARIFAVLCRENRGFKYTQGFDRYAYAFLALGAKWCNNYNVSYDVAEALSYHLTNNIISIIPMARLLDQQNELAAHFDKLQKIFMNYDREQYLKIKNGGGSLILFGVKWELVLYADDHTIDDTFRIWDQILGRLESYTDVITAMTIAHISQVYIPPNETNVIETVNHFKQWDTGKLIVTANQLLDHHRSFKEVFCEFFCPKCPSYHGYVISIEKF